MLRYKGKPERGSNRQADAFEPICKCEFIRVGLPMNSVQCSVHKELEYQCDQCMCHDYRPSEPKLNPNHWPRCVCGHVAEEHLSRSHWYSLQSGLRCNSPT